MEPRELFSPEGHNHYDDDPVVGCHLCLLGYFLRWLGCDHSICRNGDLQEVMNSLDTHNAYGMDIIIKEYEDYLTNGRKPEGPV